jgi:rhamnose utilization protein RhaD (predicted bifunctional aldolase and dehydrogenase)
MNKKMSANDQAELAPLRELSARIGSDPLFTQASTGNSSIKLDGVLWIKASGKWMADAIHEDILIPLDLAEVQACVKQRRDPAERYSRASIETAMHAVMRHRVVLHVHCVNTIAWAVRQDAQIQLERQLDGLHWQWISYVPSGLPLACEIERVLSAFPNTNVLILGNHGLVIGGDNCGAVEDLLLQVQQRVAICPRPAYPTDYAALAEIADGSTWDLPDDDGVHVLATDAISRSVLSGGLLYPCQSIFSNSTRPGMFRSVPRPNPKHQRQSRYCTRPFLIIEGCGVVVKKTMTPAQRAMMNGLAQVIQRTSSSAPLRYLTKEEVADSCSTIGSRYGSSQSESAQQVHGECFSAPSEASR